MDEGKGRELGARINSISLDVDTESDKGVQLEKTYYLLGELTIGGRDHIDIDKMKGSTSTIGFNGLKTEVELPGTTVAYTHTHGNGDPEFSTYDPFGSGDKQIAEKLKVDVYMSNKLGQLLKYSGVEKEKSTISIRIPRVEWFSGEVTTKPLR